MLKQPATIKRGTRPILIGAGLLLIGGCGGGAPHEQPDSETFMAKPRQQATRPAEAAAAPEVDVLAIESALSDPDPEVRETAVERLGDVANDEAVRGLERALLDSDADVRSAAIAELADIPGDASAAALALALWSDDPEVRADAIDALAHAGGTVSVGLIEQSLSDEDVYVRELAAERLAEMRRLRESAHAAAGLRAPLPAPR